MTTKLLVKSSYEKSEPINESIKELTEKLTSSHVNVSVVKNSSYDMESVIYSVEYDNQDKLKSDIEKFFNHRYVPYDGFDHIEPFDFTLALESENINGAYQFLNDSNLDYMKEEINLLDYIVSDVVGVQEDQQHKINSLYEFIDKSGLKYYKQVTEIILEVLQKQGLVDAEEVKKTIFKPVH